MNLYEQVYYIYIHFDPEDPTKNPVYVGRGSKDRAWMIHNRKHNPDHVNWINALLNKGYLPGDWVKIICNNLFLEEAYELEKKFLTSFNPEFNLQGNDNVVHHSAIHNEKEVKLWKELRDKGLSYHKIAHATGTDTMTVYRALIGGTIAYRKYL